ncbi:ABC transporter substrate-binding protein [Microbacteriaceae bacterium K1510]|nr:ABC transporter substrate-binding protein [Microbacteriaceae bacterium K1510]
MRSLKKLTTLLAACVGVAVFSSATQADKVSLNVAFPMLGDVKPMYEALAKRFAQEHPDIQINFDNGAKTYDEIVQRTLRGALTGGLPDVAFFSYNRLQLLSERNLLVPLDAFIAGDESWKTHGYTPSILELARVKGKYYGLPFNTSTIVVYYNADLIRQAGGSLDPLPKTWDEITALAKKVQALGGNKTGMYYDYYDTAGNWAFISLVESFGGRMMSDDDKQIMFDQPSGMQALRVLESIGKTGSVDMSRAQARQAFSAGTLGIFIVSTSYLTELSAGAQGRFDIRVGPFPLPASAGRLPAGGNAVAMLTKDPVKQKAAWEYLKFVTSPVGQTIVAQTSGYMPNNTVAIEHEDLLGAFYKAHPNHMVSIKQLPVLTGWYAFPGANALKIPDVIRDHLRDVYTLRRKPEEVMPDMVRDVKVLLPSS